MKCMRVVEKNNRCQEGELQRFDYIRSKPSFYPLPYLDTVLIPSFNALGSTIAPSQVMIVYSAPI